MSGGFLSILRSGDWLTGRRLRVYSALLLIAAILGLAWSVITADGLITRQDEPIGSDFINVYAAGRMVAEGRPAAAYDWAAHYKVEAAVAGGEIGYYGWHYPPMFLALAWVLAQLPYLWALFVYQAATLAGFVLAVRAIAPPHHRRWAVWLALAFPAVLVNLGHGQNGFLTAALLGGGLLLLDRRPWIAGLLIGLLAYKPQFGLLIPLALLCGGHWRAIAAAAVASLGSAALSWLWFGPETWAAFRDSAELTRTIVLEQGSTGWQKIQTLFSAVRMWGGGIEAAYVAQGVGFLVAAAVVARLWRSPAPLAVKAAGLVAALPFATPYLLDYDLVIVGLAVAWLAVEGLRGGFLPWEKTLLAALFVLPVVARQVGFHLLLPLTPPLLSLLLWLCLRRARQSRDRLVAP